MRACSFENNIYMYRPSQLIFQVGAMFASCKCVSLFIMFTGKTSYEC